MNDNNRDKAYVLSMSRSKFKQANLHLTKGTLSVKSGKCPSQWLLLFFVQ